ncbi:tetratricopeptide repeat protein [bacterium]|nr:tetratricopeptide repeat protein [bacterium]
MRIPPDGRSRRVVFAHPQDYGRSAQRTRLRWHRARRLEPQNGAYAFGLAHAVYAANLAEHNLRFQAVNDEVLALLSEAVAKEPYNGVYRWVYSRFLLLAGRWDAALAQEQRAIALAPRRLEYRRSMAETCENLGRLQLALAEYRACADLSPFDPELRLAIARVLVALKEPEAARLEYEKVLRLAPDDPIARSYLERHPRPDAQHVF